MATLKHLTSRLGNVKSAIRKIKCGVCIADSSIKEMDKSLTHLNKKVEKLRRKVKDKDKQMQYLYAKYLYLHSYSRRENRTVGERNFLVHWKAKAVRHREKMLLVQLMLCVISFMMPLALRM